SGRNARFASEVPDYKMPIRCLFHDQRSKAVSHTLKPSIDCFHIASITDKSQGLAFWDNSSQTHDSRIRYADHMRSSVSASKDLVPQQTYTRCGCKGDHYNG